jgi:2-amino-4-hydroxy-6-hydroxymethyldihydropteridine diphosphokinase
VALVYVGIGSNLGDSRANMDRALALLKENAAIEILAVSSFIETDPVGGPPDQPKYLNGVIKLRTDLFPLEMLSQLKMVERRLGRVKGPPSGPRPMDLDILFYDDVVIVEGKTLSVPHPRIAERLFVLKPLLEIEPDFKHPRLGKTVRQLHDELFTHENNPQSQDA